MQFSDVNDIEWRPLRDESGVLMVVSVGLSILLVVGVFIVWLLCFTRLEVTIDYETDTLQFC